MTSKSIKPHKYVQFIALLVVSFFYGYQYIIRVLPAVFSDIMTDQFGLSALEMGQFSGVYYLGYTLSHIPFGVFLDRIGLKFVLILSCSLSFLGLIPMVISDSWTMIVLGRFISGLGSSGAILSMIKVLNVYFSQSFSRLLGISATFGLMCATSAGVPLRYLIDTFGVENVMLYIIILGLILTLLSIFIQNTPKIMAKSSVLKEFFSIVLNKNLAILCGLGGLLMGALEGFADMWGVKFFTTFHMFDKDEATSLGSLIFLGMGIGGPIIGYINDIIKKPYLVMSACGLVMSICFGIIYLDISSILVFSILMIISGVASAYQIALFSKAMVYVNKSSIGSAYTNMIIMVFGYIFHTIIGLLSVGTEHMGEAISIGVAVSSIPVLCIIGTVGLFIMQARDSKKK